MNNTELDRLLKSAPVPHRPAEYWEEFPGQVQRQLDRPMRGMPKPVPVLRLAWACGLLLALALASFMAGQRVGQKQSELANGQVLQSEKFIREVMAMFPNRVRAIVKDDAGLQLVLSEAEDVPSSTPLWVRVCRDGHCVSAVTFSGQEVQIAGQKLTVLVDSADGIILLGDQFAWTSDGRGKAGPDLQIQARALEFALNR